MFPNKNWSLGGLKVLMQKKWQQRYCCSLYWVVVGLASSAQYLCCQFFISAFSPSRLQFLVVDSLSNRFAPYFLFYRKDLIKYLSKHWPQQSPVTSTSIDPLIDSYEMSHSQLCDTWHNINWKQLHMWAIPWKQIGSNSSLECDNAFMCCTKT